MCYESLELNDNIKINIDLARRNLVDSIYKQAVLEGVATTYSDTETIVNGGKVNNMTASDISKVINLKHAWEFILDEGVISYPTNYAILCQINEIVEEGFSNKGMFITLFYGFIIAFISIISFLIVPIRELLAQNLKFNFDNIRLILKNENVLIKARSICFSTLSISEIFHMVGMSNVKANLLTILKNNNNLRILAFFIGLILQIIVIQIPFMNIIFKTCPLELKEWLMVILISFIPLTIHEALVKFFSSSSL